MKNVMQRYGFLLNLQEIGAIFYVIQHIFDLYQENIESSPFPYPFFIIRYSLGEHPIVRLNKREK